MNDEKRKRLEAAGWRVGTVDEFLDTSADHSDCDPGQCVYARPHSYSSDVYQWIDHMKRECSYERLDALARALASLGLAMAQAGYMAAAWETGEDYGIATGWQPGCGRPMR